MMRTSSTEKHILGGVILLLGALLFQSLVFADASSTNFIMRDDVVTDFGGFSSSSNFQMVNAGFSPGANFASSSNFSSGEGPLDFSSFSPVSQGWRWYSDVTNETPQSALSDENSAPTNIQFQDLLKLRLTVKETSGFGLVGAKFRLQFSDFSDFSQDVSYVADIGSCGTSSTWCYADGGGVDNGIITSSTLSDAESCTGGVGNGCGTHNESGISTSTFIHHASSGKEYEFTVKYVGSRTNTVFFFRAYDTVGGVPVATQASSTYPSLVTGGAALSFVVDGLPSGTSTEGITTDVSTTPTTIPFGSLGFETQYEAAQRFTITTNASSGYQIFAFDTQPLLNDKGQQIPYVFGTNSAPLGWNTGCVTTSTGCYGYHSGDDSLSGGSPARFAPDDTYAKLENLAREVAYSPTAVVSDTIDMVYRTKVGVLQGGGSYESGITYIVVPIF